MITNSKIATNFSITSIGKLSLYFSYSTLVAIDYNNIRLRTNEFYSKTTAKHLKKLGIDDYYKVSPETLQIEVLSIIRTQDI